ncbi:MAG: EVE domain-containing protein [Chloroflexi bacterium]|nr:MAG: EVE domain-containing protein [Chloroflexota bacterium]
MAYFLAKTDPEHYSIDNLEQDKATVWDGVRSAAALLAIRAMRPDDEVLIYHSQGEAAIVGLARVVSEPRPDSNDPKSWVVDIAFIRRLEQPITLRERKCRGMAQREKSVVGDHHWITAQPGMLADAGCIPTKPRSRLTTSRCCAATASSSHCAPTTAAHSTSTNTSSASTNLLY